MWQSIVGISGVFIASFFGANLVAKLQFKDQNMVTSVIVLFATGITMALIPFYF